MYALRLIFITLQDLLLLSHTDDMTLSARADPCGHEGFHQLVTQSSAKTHIAIHAELDGLVSVCGALAVGCPVFLPHLRCTSAAPFSPWQQENCAVRAGTGLQEGKYALTGVIGAMAPAHSGVDSHEVRLREGGWGRCTLPKVATDDDHRGLIEARDLFQLVRCCRRENRLGHTLLGRLEAFYG